MSIDLKTIKHISKLSRISVDEKKAEKLAGDLNSIFDFIEKLNELKNESEFKSGLNEVIKIANCSGFYGDKLSAAKDMVDGGPKDVLTGDYLAELTMTILYNQKLKRGEDHGFVGTFLKQFKDVFKKWYIYE